MSSLNSESFTGRNLFRVIRIGDGVGRVVTLGGFDPNGSPFPPLRDALVSDISPLGSKTLHRTRKMFRQTIRLWRYDLLLCPTRLNLPL
jgi:hypothetical protein